MHLKPSARALLSAATLAVLAVSLAPLTSSAQPGRGGRGGGGFGIDPRAEERSYVFANTGEEMPYCVFASSKIDPDTPAPLIISLHGLGAGPQIMCNTTAIDLAEEHGYILAAPMGYNVGGWFGSPVIAMGGRGRGGRGGGDAAAAPQGPNPSDLARWSEQDAMTVLDMMKREFNVDANRIYLTGHSMGGAGTYYLGSKHADIWAAIAPVAPAAFMMSANHRELLQRLADADVPVMVVHGDADEVVGVEISRTWTATMKDLGMDYEYVELPDITHGPVITASQKYIYDFFDEHAK
jgi:predicted peptidase